MLSSFRYPFQKGQSSNGELRKTAVYDIQFARTNKFKNSFLLFALNNYV